MANFDVFGQKCKCDWENRLHSENCPEAVLLAQFTKSKEKAVIDYVKFVSQFGWPGKGIFPTVQIFKVVGKSQCLGKLIKTFQIED